MKKDQVLASFFAPEAEFRSAQQSYYTGLEAFYRMAVTQPQPQPQSQSHAADARAEAIERMADGLRTMGVSNSQLREMAKRRELVHDIRVESPVDGVVLKRSVSPGLRFDRGFEFYRIADLNRVWILADVYRHQLPFIRRGASARITTAEESRALSATVSPSEPIFDEATLTLKVRLEAANPQRALKPGMFVDVEFPVDLPATLVVPADAIVDSGLRKTVFVDRGNGYFEPRLVETGWRIGDDVEVTKGLMPGERIVISGTFFVDSESRMKRPEREAMIDRIIDFSVRNKFLVLLLVGAAALAGARALRNVPLDAIPDLGDTQVIVYSRWDRSPDLIEAQVTYPIVTAMLGAPRVKAVRGVSDFGYSFVYVIFEDGTDTYWARTRTLEYLSGVLSRLPPDARTELGPDATGLGWVFQYALVDRSGRHSLADLRSYQDWYLRYYLKAVPGVSEVASLGGFGRQYQVNVDPNRLRNYGLSIQRVVEAVRGGNAETGRSAHRVRRHRVHGARPRLREVGRRLREHRRVRQRERHADPDPRHRPRDGRPGSAARRGRSGRRRRSGVGDRRDAPGRERGRRDRSRQGAHPPDRAGLAVRDGDRPDLRPLGADPPRDRQRERDARRGGAHRRLHRAAVPVARAERAHPAHHHSGCRARGVHPVPRDGDHGEHHVARRHRDRDGRAGGRGDRRRGTDPQEARAGAARRIDARLSRGRPRGGQGGGAGELLRAARDRGVVPPGADARVAGRAAVQAARLHQDAHDARGGGPRDHARPRAARALHARAALRVPARVALPGGQRGARRPHPLRGVASHQPLPHADVRAGRPLVAAVEVVGDRRRRGARRRHGAGVHAPRIGVHAAAPRGVALLHADDDARHLDRRGAEAGAGERPGNQAVPRGRSRARQGGARRHEHRSRAALDARDGDHAQADVRVAPGRDVVLRVGAGMDEARAPARHARSHLRRAAGRGDERGR